MKNENTDLDASAVSRPAFLKERYARLALITEAAQLDLAARDDALIVSCDWLLAKRAVQKGLHCVHYELGLLDWTPPQDLDNGLFIRPNDWVYDNGNDVTMFDGASLGKMFNQVSTMCMINYHRMERSLSSLIDMFSPEEIVFYDFRNDLNILSRELSVHLVKGVTTQHGLLFSDAKAAPDGSANAIAETPVAAVPESLGKRILAWGYCRIVESVSRIGCIFRSARPKTLVLVNTNMAEPLLRHFDGIGVTPVFWSRTPPKRLRFLIHCFARGVLFISPAQASLSDTDHQKLARIKEAIIAMRGSKSLPRVEFLLECIIQEVVLKGKLEAAALEYKIASRTLVRLQPAHVVVDGVRSQSQRAYLEYASANRIGTDYIWHSPLVPQDFMIDSLGGDPKTKPLVSRCLSWGPVNEIWLDDVEAKMPTARVGTPWGGRYSHQPPPPNRGKDTKILILQYTPNSSDLAGLNSNMYSSLVTLVRELNAAGYHNIHYKLHPGRGRWKTGYFREIADAYGIDVKILKPEPYEECVRWSDVVIGPLLSGALFETLSLGRPYFALFLAPHKTYPNYYGDFVTYDNIDDVVTAIGGDREESMRTAHELMNAVCSTDTIANGAAAFWSALRDDKQKRTPSAVLETQND